jgi:hypothetical protein
MNSVSPYTPEVKFEPEDKTNRVNILFTNAAQIDPDGNNETHCYPYSVVYIRMPEIHDGSGCGQLGLDIMNDIRCRTIRRPYLVMSPDGRVTFRNVEN